MLAELKSGLRIVRGLLVRAVELLAHWRPERPEYPLLQSIVLLSTQLPKVLTSCMRKVAFCRAYNFGRSARPSSRPLPSHRAWTCVWFETNPKSGLHCAAIETRLCNPLLWGGNEYWAYWLCNICYGYYAGVVRGKRRGGASPRWNPRRGFLG